ncbi:uncharacterized protein [Branchiostoma lanceolatum]|uniref:uncharacterized protein n=1 Tax=Branchiostoma lanceolatum TaxID=7740 RepID=UPI003451F769
MDASSSRCFCCRQCLSCTYFTCFGESLLPSRSSCGGYSITSCSCRCREEVTCTCKCNVGNVHDVLQKLASITGGAVLVVGGAALAVGSGGTALPVLGGMVGGAGLSSTIHGAVKAGKGEKISAGDYFVDVGVGFVTGAVGSGGAIVTEKIAENLATTVATEVSKEACVQGGTKLAVRMTGGAASSVVNTAVNEAGTCVKGKRDWRDYGDDDGMWVKGAAIGAAAGIGSHAWLEIKETALDVVQDILKNQDVRSDGPRTWSEVKKSDQVQTFWRNTPDGRKDGRHVWSEVTESEQVLELLRNKKDGGNNGPHIPPSNQNTEIWSELVIPAGKAAWSIHGGLGETDGRTENNSMSHFHTSYHRSTPTGSYSAMFNTPSKDARFIPSQQPGPYIHTCSPPSQQPGPWSRPSSQQPGPWSRPSSQQPGPWSRPSSQQPGPWSRSSSQQPGPWSRPSSQQPGPWSRPSSQQPGPWSRPSSQPPGQWGSPPCQPPGPWSSPPSMFSLPPPMAPNNSMPHVSPSWPWHPAGTVATHGVEGQAFGNLSPV